MTALIDLARIRRMRFESLKTEEQLATIDFDEYGNPRPLQVDLEGPHPRPGAIEETDLRKRMSPGAIDALIRIQPGLARRLGLFPKLKMENENGNEEDDREETKADHAVL